MMNTVTSKPVWADRLLRIDPRALPQTAYYVPTGAVEPVSYTVGAKGVVIRQVNEQSGTPIARALSFGAFDGIAARAMEDEAGDVTVTLELHHSDPSLCVPLLVASDLDDIAADWRGWSDRVGLPMLMVEADGVARTLEQSLGKIRTDTPSPRRAGRAVTRRRPRFLARRQTGSMGVSLKVGGQEIIARR